ncbi:MAG: DUF4430 domain-containing protein [Planctomycetota bacterium]
MLNEDGRLMPPGSFTLPKFEWMFGLEFHHGRSQNGNVLNSPAPDEPVHLFLSITSNQSNQFKMNSITLNLSRRTNLTAKILVLLILIGCLTWVGCYQGTPSTDIDTKPDLQRSEQIAVDDQVGQPESNIENEVLLSVVQPGQTNPYDISMPLLAESTVFSVMEKARENEKFDFESSGTGELVFIHSIAGIPNSGRDGNNWIYWVNGELGDRSCGVYPIQPGDRIEWRFEKYP